MVLYVRRSLAAPLQLSDETLADKRGRGTQGSAAHAQNDLIWTAVGVT